MCSYGVNCLLAEVIGVFLRCWLIVCGGIGGVRMCGYVQTYYRNPIQSFWGCGGFFQKAPTLFLGAGAFLKSPALIIAYISVYQQKTPRRCFSFGEYIDY